MKWVGWQWNLEVLCHPSMSFSGSTSSVQSPRQQKSCVAHSVLECWMMRKCNVRAVAMKVSSLWQHKAFWPFQKCCLWETCSHAFCCDGHSSPLGVLILSGCVARLPTSSDRTDCGSRALVRVTNLVHDVNRMVTVSMRLQFPFGWETATNAACHHQNILWQSAAAACEQIPACPAFLTQVTSLGAKISPSCSFFKRSRFGIEENSTGTRRKRVSTSLFYQNLPCIFLAGV